jgi:hypothetical protein
VAAAKQAVADAIAAEQQRQKDAAAKIASLTRNPTRQRTFWL